VWEPPAAVRDAYDCGRIKDSIVGAGPDWQRACRGDPRPSRNKATTTRRTPANRSDVLPGRHARTRLRLRDKQATCSSCWEQRDMVDHGPNEQIIRARPPPLLGGRGSVKPRPTSPRTRPDPRNRGGASDDGRDATGFSVRWIGSTYKLVGRRRVSCTTTSRLNQHKFARREDGQHIRTSASDCVRWRCHRVWGVEGTLKPAIATSTRSASSTGGGDHRLFPFFTETLFPPSKWRGTAEQLRRRGQACTGDNIQRSLYEQEFGAHGDANCNLDLQTGVWFLQAAHTPWARLLMRGPRAPIALLAESLVGAGLR